MIEKYDTSIPVDPEVNVVIQTFRRNAVSNNRVVAIVNVRGGDSHHLPADR
jgi:hypothetical protein